MLLAIMKSRKRSTAYTLVPALLLVCASSALTCQIEYSDWLVNVFREQGSSLEKGLGVIPPSPRITTSFQGGEGR